MPVLIGELEKITGSPSSVTQVMVRAHETRITGSALTTDELVPIPVDRQGRFEVSLRPGKAVLVLVHGGRVGGGGHFPMLVEEGLGTIASAIKLASDRFDDYELDELERAAADMLSSLDKSLVAATRAEVAKEDAEKARDKAGEHRDDAEKAASTAAADAATSAVQKADEKLSGYVTAAEGHAEDSKDSATSAGKDAGRAEAARKGAETIQQGIPDKIDQELETKLPGELDTRVPAELDKHLPGELDERVPPLVAESIADDRAVADAAAAAVEPLAQGAVDEAADAIKWVKDSYLPSNTNLNNWSDDGSWMVSGAIANTLLNTPIRQGEGVFSQAPAGGGKKKQTFTFTPSGQPTRTLERSGIPGGTWNEWQATTNQPEWLPLGADVTDVIQDGHYTVPSASWSNQSQGIPDQVRGTPFILDVDASWTTGTNFRAIQTIKTLPAGMGSQSREYVQTITQEGVMAPWEEKIDASVQTAPPTEATMPKVDMRRQSSRLRRGGVVGTAGRTPVGLSFDHGFTNFRDLVLPHLVRLGLPATVAVNPDDFGKSSDLVTWEELQEWSLNHGIELAHHSRSHGDVPDALSNQSELEHMILSSIEETRTHAPEVVADAYIMPGVSGTAYQGFGTGLDENGDSRWWSHPAGRMILGNFPVVTSAMLGQAVPLAGDPVQTIDRIGMDYGSHATIAQDKIQSCYGTHLGVNIFMHPSQLTVDGRISPDNLVSVLEWLAAERDAGRLEVLTVSGFAWADPNRHTRLDVAPAEKWSEDTYTVQIDPLMNWVSGAQMMLETTATESGILTMTATSDAGGLEAAVTHDAVAGRRYRLVVSIPRSAKAITLSAPGSDRSCRVV